MAACPESVEEQIRLLKQIEAESLPEKRTLAVLALKLGLSEPTPRQPSCSDRHEC